MVAGQLSTRDHPELVAGLEEGEAFTPQILAAKPAEARALSEQLVDHGHQRLNLHVLDKMKALWSYLAHSFDDAPRVARRFKKVRTVEKYQNLVDLLFR